LPCGRRHLPSHATHGTVPGIVQRTGKLMAEKKPASKRGRKPPDGEKKQFLTSMDPDVIRRIKAAAALRDQTASFVLEEAAKDWLDRHQDGKK
jgi:hypothetical protein